MIASLAMYLRPEIEGAVSRYWASLRAALADHGIDSPTALSQQHGEFDVWLDPSLTLSQTCGMPFRLWLHGRVTYIGTPDYGLDGCPAGYYRSAFVVRADDARATLDAFRDARFAYNQTFSQSGFAAPFNHLRPDGWWFGNRLQTHSHAASARAVADGLADIAALDGVTWALIRRHDRFSRNLRVLDLTAPTPGLPYIAGPGANQTAMFAAVSSAIAALHSDDRAALMLRGLVDIPLNDYLAVANPDEGLLQTPDVIRAEGL